MTNYSTPLSSPGGSTPGGGTVDSVTFNGVNYTPVGGVVSFNGATVAQGNKADSALQSSDVAPVALTGAYSDLTGLPNLAPLATAIQSASNVGSSGLGLFKQKTGTDLEFRKIEAGTNVTITLVGDTYVIASSGGGGGGGEANTASSAGTGTSIVLAKSGVNLPFRSFLASAGLTWSTSTNEITITLDATLQALASLVTAADQLIYATGVDTFAMTAFPSYSRTLLTKTNQADWLTQLGIAQTFLKKVTYSTSIGQTSFAFSGGYTVGMTQVFRGGQLQHGTYTATNGTDVIFTAPSEYVDEEIIIITFTPFAVANAITEAPIDGTPYVRKDGGWVQGLSSTFGTAADSAKLNGQPASYYALASAVAPLVNSTQRLHIQEQQPSGTAGGTTSAGYNVRRLSDVLVNTISGASLNVGTFEVTLPAGTYEIDATTVIASGSAIQGRAAVQSTGGAALLIAGDNAYVAGATQNSMPVKGILTFAVTTVIRLATYVSAGTATAGAGNAVGQAGVREVYSNFMVRRLA